MGDACGDLFGDPLGDLLGDACGDRIGVVGPVVRPSSVPCAAVLADVRVTLVGLDLRGLEGGKRVAAAAAGLLVTTLVPESPGMAHPVGVSQGEGLALRKPKPCNPDQPKY